MFSLRPPYAGSLFRPTTRRGRGAGAPTVRAASVRVASVRDAPVSLAEVEALEERLVLTTTMYLDFGAGLDLNGEDLGTVNEFAGIFGPGLGGNGTGSNLEGRAGLQGGDVFNFRALQYDFDGNGVFNLNDVTALSDAVAPIVQRALEPFDIDVVVSAASSFADAVALVGGNDGDPTGENDAYNFITDVRSPRFGGGSVGDNTGLFGVAAADDLFAQQGNRQDEATFTFADNIFDSTSGTPGTAAFNQNLAFRIAYTAAHEAFHTFTGIHSTGLEAGGDIIRLGSATREDPFGVVRFDLNRQNGFAVAEPNNYLFLANDPDIGLRDENRNGIPDLAYISGTGGHDTITVTRGAGNTANVVVAAYDDAARTNLIGTENYVIDLDADAEGEILIDGGTNSDFISIEAGIDASFRIRGGTGREASFNELDEVVVDGAGSGVSAVAVAAPGGGTLTLSDGRTIVVSEAEDFSFSGFRPPGPGNPATNLTVAALEDGVRDLETAFRGTFSDPDGGAVTALVDWGDGTTGALNVEYGFGGGVLTGSHVYRQTGDYTVRVTLFDSKNPAITAATDVDVDVLGLRIDRDGGGRGVYVVGTGGNDRIAVNSRPGGVAVTWNGRAPVDFSPDTRVVVFGGDGRDVISASGALALPVNFHGEGGKDRLFGGGGDDLLDGGDGSDLLDGGAGDDELHGGGGRNYLLGRGGNDRLFGGDGDRETLDGGSGDDEMHGGGGDDYMVGRGGDDRLFGGDGRDHLRGNDGDDVLEGGAGNDQLHGGRGNDRADAGAGNDFVDGWTGDDELRGGDGNDYIVGREGDDRLFGDAGRDQLRGNDGNDFIDGGDDSDPLFGGRGDDVIFAGAGNDLVDGWTGDDELHGGDGNDYIVGREGDDELRGEAGDDHLRGNDGDDSLYGGDGNDELHGGRGDDNIRGEDGSDSLFGFSGRNVLVGGPGPDRLVRGSGPDLLIDDRPNGVSPSDAPATPNPAASTADASTADASVADANVPAAPPLTVGDAVSDDAPLDLRDALFADAVFVDAVFADPGDLLLG